MGYQKETRGDTQLSRAKKVAMVSHVNGQRQSLQTLLSKGNVRHLIVTRTFDDTNVTIAPHTRTSKQLPSSNADPELEEGADATTAAGKLGQRKVGSLLGIVQRVSLRSSATQTLDTAQLHSPSQVLPKARAGSRAGPGGAGTLAF